MSKELVKTENLPTVAELFSDDLEKAFKHEQLNALLSKEPKKEWVKTHPYISEYKYLPIDKVEFMLRMIFKHYRIEITGQGTAFNGVWVTVRVHYLNPANGQMEFHDGIGACELQTKKGASPADLANINRGAISIAFPIAKTVAIKDACDHFGRLFGADLNRKDLIPFKMDNSLNPGEHDWESLEQLAEDKWGLLSESEQKTVSDELIAKIPANYTKTKNLLNSKK